MSNEILEAPMYKSPKEVEKAIAAQKSKDSHAAASKSGQFKSTELDPNHSDYLPLAVGDDLGIAKKQPGAFDKKAFEPKNKPGSVKADAPLSPDQMSDEQWKELLVNGVQEGGALMNAIRELVRTRIKEVVRKKGGGYALYAPNKGKKGKSKQVGTFPTKLGAKRAELARFPPKDPGKLQRLRKSIDKMSKDPEKRAEKEAQAAKSKPGKKKESLVRENTEFKPANPNSTVLAMFVKKLKEINVKHANNKPVLIAEKRKLWDSYKANQTFRKDCGPQLFDKLSNLLGGLTKAADTQVGKAKETQMADPGTISKIDTSKSALDLNGVSRDKKLFYEKRILSTIIKKSLTETMFREEKTGSDWDEYISKLSKSALAGDSKFQNLQKGIARKTESILEDALMSIKKAVGKSVKINNFGIKKDGESGETYLAFGADFEDSSAEPIYIHIESGVPKIELSQQAKVALTKTEPHAAKLFRAELVTVQEGVLDSMDELAKAIQSRDKYLLKLEAEVDGYVAGLSSLQVSLLKQLLVKKYRKIT